MGVKTPKSDFDARANEKNKPKTASDIKKAGKARKETGNKATAQKKKHKSSGKGQ